MAFEAVAVTPILRFSDLGATLRFYVDWLGFTVDWQDGDGTGPTYLQVSRAGARLQLSSHHDDGTPGSAVLIEGTDLEALHAEIAVRDFPFFNPALEEGPAGGLEVQVIDPASNRLRFWERARPQVA